MHVVLNRCFEVIWYMAIDNNTGRDQNDEHWEL